MKYDFKTGDYIETLEGRTGYIEILWRAWSSWGSGQCENGAMIINFTDGNRYVVNITDSGICIDGNYYMYENYFVRIGKYDFRKIKPKYNIGQKFEIDYPQSKEDVLIKIHGCFKVVSISIRNEQVYYQMVDRYNGVFLTVKEEILDDCCKA